MTPDQHSDIVEENARVSVNKILNPEICAKCNYLKIMTKEYQVDKWLTPLIKIDDYYCVLYTVVSTIRYPICKINNKNKVKFRKAKGTHR